MSKVFDIGDRDLPVLTSANWVIKCWMIKWPVKLYVRLFYVFTFFFKIQKTCPYNTRELWGHKFYRHSTNLILSCDFYDFLIRHFKKKNIKSNVFVEIWKKRKIRILEHWYLDVPVTEVEALAVRLSFLEHTDAGTERRRVLLIVGAIHTHTHTVFQPC